MSDYENNVPEQPTVEARRKCAEFLVEMLRIGWHKSQLDELERLWWTVRDNRGNVKGRQFA